MSEMTDDDENLTPQDQVYYESVQDNHDQRRLRLPPVSRQGPSVYRPRPPPEATGSNSNQPILSGFAHGRNFNEHERLPFLTQSHIPESFRNDQHQHQQSRLTPVPICPRGSHPHQYPHPNHSSNEHVNILETRRIHRRERKSGLVDDERICRFIDKFTQQINTTGQGQDAVGHSDHSNNYNEFNSPPQRKSKQEGTRGSRSDYQFNGYQPNPYYGRQPVSPPPPYPIYSSGALPAYESSRNNRIDSSSSGTSVMINSRETYYQTGHHGHYPSMVPYHPYPYPYPYCHPYHGYYPQGYYTNPSQGHVCPETGNFIYPHPQHSYTHFPHQPYYPHGRPHPPPAPSVSSHGHLPHPHQPSCSQTQFPSQQQSQTNIDQNAQRFHEPLRTLRPAESFFSQSTTDIHQEVNLNIQQAQVTLKTTQVETTVAAATSASTFHTGSISVFPSVEALTNLNIGNGSIPMPPPVVSTPTPTQSAVSQSPPFSPSDSEDSIPSMEAIEVLGESTVPLPEIEPNMDTQEPDLPSATRQKHLKSKSILPLIKYDATGDNNPLPYASTLRQVESDTAVEVKGETKSESNIWDFIPSAKKTKRKPWSLKHKNSDEKLRRIASENAMLEYQHQHQQNEEVQGERTRTKYQHPHPPTRSGVKSRLGLRLGRLEPMGPSQDELFLEIENDLPTKTLEEGIMLLESEEWLVNVVGLKVISMKSKENWEEFIDELGVIVPLVHRHLRSPKSKLCRQAICCIRDLFMNLGCNMDSQLEKVSERLFAKCMDTNKFIKDECEATLGTMVRMCSPAKVLHCLETVGRRHCNVIVRRMTCKMVRLFIDFIGPDVALVEYSDRILPMLLTFMDERPIEIRTEVKNALKMLIPLPGFSKYVKRYVNPKTLNSVQDRLEKLQDEIFNIKRRKLPKHLLAS